jgi:oligoendopeptidase F
VYAQLFVYALYQKYREEGKAFVPKMKQILSAGSSLSPIEIGSIVGFDVSSREFWNVGMRQYEYFLRELEKIVG